MGTPEFATSVLEALANKYEVVLVVSQPNRAKKKNVFVETPVAKKANELGLKLIQPEKIKDEFEVLESVKADVLGSAAYGQYIPTKILNLFKYTLNVHGSLLPKHRGGAPIQRCLINGDEKTGISIIEMAKKLDAGKVYSMKEYIIEEDDNNTSLFSKLSIIGRDLLLDTIEDVYSGKNVGVPQNEDEYTYSPNIAPEEEMISLNKDAKDIVNLVRGLSYEPGAYLLVGDVKLKVFKARVVEDDSNLQPGTVISTKKKIVLKAGKNAVELLEVLMPGKKIISGKDFANGQKIFIEGNVLSC